MIILLDCCVIPYCLLLYLLSRTTDGEQAYFTLSWIFDCLPLIHYDCYHVWPSNENVMIIAVVLLQFLTFCLYWQNGSSSQRENICWPWVIPYAILSHGISDNKQQIESRFLHYYASSLKDKELTSVSYHPRRAEKWEVQVTWLSNHGLTVHSDGKIWIWMFNHLCTSLFG